MSRKAKIIITEWNEQDSFIDGIEAIRETVDNEIKQSLDAEKALPFCTACTPAKPCPLHSGGEYR